MPAVVYQRYAIPYQPAVGAAHCTAIAPANPAAHFATVAPTHLDAHSSAVRAA
jgi:hypothetical protein